MFFCTAYNALQLAYFHPLAILSLQGKTESFSVPSTNGVSLAQPVPSQGQLQYSTSCLAGPSDAVPGSLWGPGSPGPITALSILIGKH